MFTELSTAFSTAQLVALAVFIIAEVAQLVMLGVLVGSRRRKRVARVDTRGAWGLPAIAEDAQQPPGRVLTPFEAAQQRAVWKAEMAKRNGGH